MSAPHPIVVARSVPARRVTLSLLAILAAVLLVACGANPTGGGAKLVEYQRIWPDGKTEIATIYTDGRVEMKHGDFLERLTLSTDDVQVIKDALEQPIPTGSPEDSPKRSLVLPDGTTIQSPRLDDGTVTALLDHYMDTHIL